MPMIIGDDFQKYQELNVFLLTDTYLTFADGTCTKKIHILTCLPIHSNL